MTLVTYNELLVYPQAMHSFKKSTFFVQSFWLCNKTAAIMCLSFLSFNPTKPLCIFVITQSPLSIILTAVFLLLLSVNINNEVNKWEWICFREEEGRGGDCSNMSVHGIHSGCVGDQHNRLNRPACKNSSYFMVVFILHLCPHYSIIE